jgi:hypothetical protein
MNQTNNLIGLATIPSPELIQKQNAAGNCITGTDGICIHGGIKVAGESGYDLAQFQPPGVAKCAAFPLFCSTRLPYTSTSQGYQCSTNALQLQSQIHEF